MQLAIEKFGVISLTFSAPVPFHRFFSLTKAQQPLVRVKSNFGNEKWKDSAADHEIIIVCSKPFKKSLDGTCDQEYSLMIKILA